MNAYTYEALNLKGQLCKGQVQADNARMARTLLREQTLIPLHVEPLHADRIAPGQAAAHGLQRVLWARAAFGASTLAVWTRQLAGLVTAGLPLERALTALIDEAEEPRQAAVVAALRADVNAGSSLAQALSHHPSEFSAMVVSVVEVGGGDKGGGVLVVGWVLSVLCGGGGGQGRGGKTEVATAGAAGENASPGSTSATRASRL